MRCFLVGISGYSRTGKDTVAHRLVKQHNAIHLGMTDHAKRHMADAYGFTEEQLFGPSEARNAGDLRYPKPIFFQNKCCRLGKPAGVFSRNSAEIISGKTTGERILLDPDKIYYTCEGRGPKGTEGLPYQPTKLGAARYFIEEGDPRFWLSPREILQQYCELLESLYLGSLIDYAVQTHLELTPESDHGEGYGIFPYRYNRMTGLKRCDPKEIRNVNGAFMTCFSDFRRKHQIQGARDHAGNRLTPVIIRVKRPGIEKPPFKHISETEQASIPDSAFDFVINNDGTIDELNTEIDKIVEAFTSGGWEHLKTHL